ncbi:MAG: acetyl-CoA carboxylase biotin carboxylase subunit [Deltaproteobacteria bacterium]|nr:acetyl-CoA carboxylase biotin carboxylase subunit [Deltaproteobacteria bacterium]
MFGKILIANRGEIAVRVVRACRALGVRSVAIYSEADADALHVRLADEAHPCGPARATESYLDVAKVVGLAKACGADAVHPGYGFLSENAAFAQAVLDAGLVFIGPPPEVIRAMGGKIPARERMRAAGVPVVPGGREAIRDLEEARSTAAALGYPVLVKASAGGGGRGMRRVEDEGGLEAALERARSEAKASFGDDTIYLEKYLSGPRHIEIQVLADQQGKTLHLGERECSIQRRHQKLVEEAPAYGMTEALRAAMGEAAVRAAKAVGYVGAGTCEFMMDSSGAFYFLEMNTRIQVEHPVTEAVTGLDLVALQIRIAAGEALPLEQADVRLAGHAIEARVYAEDPDAGFVPSPGPILAWQAPAGPGIRLDAGFDAGMTVTPHYDAMLAKLIAQGADRAEALERLAEALEQFWVAGIKTGIPFLRRLVSTPTFRAGAYDTGFLEAEMAQAGSILAPPRALEETARVVVLGVAAWRAACDGHGEVDGAADGGDAAQARAAQIVRVTLPRQEGVEVEIAAEAASATVRLRVGVEGRTSELELSVAGEPAGRPVDGVVFDVRLGGAALRISLVRKKAGDFELGLRDRVVRVRTELR